MLLESKFRKTIFRNLWTKFIDFFIKKKSANKKKTEKKEMFYFVEVIVEKFRQNLCFKDKPTTGWKTK